MKVLLIDADSKIPNLALMKLSIFHKAKGDSVKLKKANIAYYPSRKKIEFVVPKGFDKTYCSVIFQGNKDFIKGDGIIFGGTGVSLNKNLPADIEALPPDYSIYPENEFSYGFISRGCIRKCPFCVVPKKEGYIKQVHTAREITKHKKTRFLDNNFLALPNHKKILRELISRKIRCEFFQGLDIRLIDAENSELLRQLRYLGEYIFAFDDIKYQKVIERALNRLSWKKDWKFKFFVYCDPNKPIGDIVKRVEFLRLNKCLPYIMRDIACWDSKNRDFYIDYAAYCNQPSIFKKMDFKEFLSKRYTKNRKRAHNVWGTFINSSR